MIDKKIIVISGPTASGKTSYSIQLAKEKNGIIINADSMQIYKGLPILSAQPNDAEKNNIEHLLFSYLNPNENCNVGLWLKLVNKSIEYCFKKGKTPIVVGGTGMYISKLIDGISPIPEIPEEIRNKTIETFNNAGYNEFYKKCLEIDKEYTERLNPNDKQRLMRLMEVYQLTKKSITYYQNMGNNLLYPKDFFYHININPQREILYNNCKIRFNKLVNELNVIDEVKNFIKNYKDIINNLNNYSISKTIGLQECIDYINKKITKEFFIEKSIQKTRNYAKRQYTWFRHQFKSFDLSI